MRTSCQEAGARSSVEFDAHSLEAIMNVRRRDIFLKIEPLPDYSPLAPVACARHFGRDCMFNHGHESGRIPAQEILASTADGLVYREYLDSHYTVPNKAKLIEADVNEPP